MFIQIKMGPTIEFDKARESTSSANPSTPNKLALEIKLTAMGTTIMFTKVAAIVFLPMLI